jgi:DNA-binding NarL/FixJ family response regulator
MQASATTTTSSSGTASDQSSRRTVVALAIRDKPLATALAERLRAEAGVVAEQCPSFEPPVLLAWLKESHADVLLLDERWLQQFRPDAVPDVRAAPEQCVLIVGERACTALAEAVVRHRFQGFLIAADAADVCVKALRTVQRGETWMPRELLVELLLEHIRPAGDRPLEILDAKLTRRETEVVSYVRRGFANKKIAESLAITEDTVKKHLRSAFIKLGVHRRSEIMTGKQRLTIG